MFPWQINDDDDDDDISRSIYHAKYEQLLHSSDVGLSNSAIALAAYYNTVNNCASQQVVGEIFNQFPILLPFNLEKYILTSNLFIKHVSLSELNYLGRLNMATHYTPL